jgi:hypothetical protein
MCRFRSLVSETPSLKSITELTIFKKYGNALTVWLCFSIAIVPFKNKVRRGKNRSLAVDVSYKYRMIISLGKPQVHYLTVEKTN